MLSKKRWLLVEIQGGIWIEGRHSRGIGMENDMEKLNAAQLAGHICLFCSEGHIRKGLALLWIESALKD